MSRVLRSKASAREYFFAGSGVHFSFLVYSLVPSQQKVHDGRYYPFMSETGAALGSVPVSLGFVLSMDGGPYTSTDS